MVALTAIFMVLIIQNTKSETKSCNSSCECIEDGVCELHCIGDDTCNGPENILQCRPGFPCHIICDTGAKNARHTCDSATIFANGALNLTVHCLGDTSCVNTIIDCNGTDYCDIICHDNYHPHSSAVCGNTQLNCDTSACNLDCDATKSCELMHINTDQAQSFHCNNVCDAEGIPPSFTRTSHPMTTYFTSTLNESSSLNSTLVPTVPRNQISSTLPVISSTDSISTTNVKEDTTSAAISSTISLSTTAFEEDTTFAAISSTVSLSTTTAVADSTFAAISSTQSISTTNQLHTTRDDIFLTVMVGKTAAIHEQEVMDKTTEFESTENEADVESDRKLDKHMVILSIYKEIWFYPAIAGCLCLCVLIILCCRKKKVTEAKPSKLQPIMHKKPSPGLTIATKPAMAAVESLTVTPVTIPSAATPVVPITPSINMNLNVIKDSMPQSFSEYLENGALASSLVMNDIVDNMVSTPGHFDHGEDTVVIGMNLSYEGVINDIEVIGEQDVDVDDIIIDDKNEITVFVKGETNKTSCENMDDDEDILQDVNQMTGIETGENEEILGDIKTIQ